jgi:hypothetical protein
MDTLSWVTLFLAIATFSLAGAAFWSIWQTHNIQKKEYRRRLLNDLIEWAIAITNWRSKHNIIFKEMALTADKRERMLLMLTHIAQVKEDFVALRSRSQYAINVSEKFAGILQDATIGLATDVEKHMEFLNDWTRVVADNISENLIETQEYDDYHKKADQLIEQIDESARKVIEEAVKINVP